jgi:excisionase family DNA binding protein
MTPASNGTLISAEALGEQLNLPPASVRRLAREGTLPCYRAGRLLRFSVAEVLESMKDNGQQGNEERA